MIVVDNLNFLSGLQRSQVLPFGLAAFRPADARHGKNAYRNQQLSHFVTLSEWHRRIRRKAGNAAFVT